MTKTLDAVVEAIRNSKHSFQNKADGSPKKAQKRRYERRKVKEYLHIGDWVAPEEAAT